MRRAAQAATGKESNVPRTPAKPHTTLSMVRNSTSFLTKLLPPIENVIRYTELCVYTCVHFSVLNVHPLTLTFSFYIVHIS